MNVSSTVLARMILESGCSFAMLMPVNAPSPIDPELSSTSMMLGRTCRFRISSGSMPVEVAIRALLLESSSVRPMAAPEKAARDQPDQ